MRNRETAHRNDIRRRSKEESITCDELTKRAKSLLRANVPLVGPQSVTGSCPNEEEMKLDQSTYPSKRNQLGPIPWTMANRILSIAGQADRLHIHHVQNSPGPHLLLVPHKRHRVILFQNRPSTKKVQQSRRISHLDPEGNLRSRNQNRNQKVTIQHQRRHHRLLQRLHQRLLLHVRLLPLPDRLHQVSIFQLLRAEPRWILPVPHNLC